MFHTIPISQNKNGWLRRRVIQNKMQYTTVSAKQRMNNYAFVALFLWQKTNNDIGKENSQQPNTLSHTCAHLRTLPIRLYVSACFCGTTIPTEVIRWVRFSKTFRLANVESIAQLFIYLFCWSTLPNGPKKTISVEFQLLKIVFPYLLLITWWKFKTLSLCGQSNMCQMCEWVFQHKKVKLYPKQNKNRCSRPSWVKAQSSVFSVASNLYESEQTCFVYTVRCTYDFVCMQHTLYLQARACVCAFM